MTFLKKFGLAILKGIAIVSGVAPTISQQIPSSAGPIQTISKDLTQIAQIIASIEAVGAALGLPGTQKLTAAAPQVAQIILQSTLLVNHKIANSALFNQGCTKVADGMADILNSLDESGVKVEDKA